MIDALPLACRCGRLRGRALDVAPAQVNRVVCYCHDCRAFVRWLGRLDLLDPSGGTDVVQVARANVVFDDGFDQVRCMRLSETGLFRFYTDCCKTPVGNAIPRVPFLGLSASFFQVEELAPHTGVAGRVQGRSALGPLTVYSDFQPRMWAHLGGLLLRWWVRGLYGNALFDRERRTLRVPLRVLTPAERAVLADTRP